MSIVRRYFALTGIGLCLATLCASIAAARASLIPLFPLALVMLSALVAITIAVLLPDSRTPEPAETSGASDRDDDATIPTLPALPSDALTDVITEVRYSLGAVTHRATDGRPDPYARAGRVPGRHRAGPSPRPRTTWRANTSGGDRDD